MLCDVGLDGYQKKNATGSAHEGEEWNLRDSQASSHRHRESGDSGKYAMIGPALEVEAQSSKGPLSSEIHAVLL